MRRSTLLLLMVFAATPLSHAEEGMWQPHQLTQLREELSSLGLELDPGEMTDLLGHPMNAVVSLGGCTASFVSPEGLVITNHHCAHGAIQYNSTEESNLLENGFVAETKAEELPAGPGRRVLLTVDVTEVTEEIRRGLSDEPDPRQRYEAIEKREKALVADCESDEGHRCRIASFHGGLEYYRIKQLEIRDVRLVYAPSDGIGNYGGEIDNWMWPRHTGDFAFYRAYVGKDGKPAEHHEENVPFRPRHFLRVANEGLEAGDFVMVAGYPGGTSRHRLAVEVEDRFGWFYPTRKRAFERSLEILAAQTGDRPDAAIKYAGLVARMNNAAKNYQGMLDGFAKSDIVERKKDLEKRLQSWIESDESRRERFLPSFHELRELIEERRAVRERTMYYSFVRRSAMLSAARTLYRLSEENRKPDAEREPGYQKRDLDRIKARMTRMDRTFDAKVDRALWRQAILDYTAIPSDQHVPEFDEWFGIEGSSVDGAKLDRRLAKMYRGSELGDLGNRLAWMERSPEEFKRSDDPFIRLAVTLFPGDLRLEEEAKTVAGRFMRLRSAYMESLVAYLGGQGRPVYPDANGTLRVTYGTVQGYSPRDATQFAPFTTLSGLLEKETGEPPFHSPERLMQAVAQGRLGRFRDEALDSVPVNFLSTVDTTGGNSGSPTLNSKGELVGLLFDGNYESIVADWDYIPPITRSIHVDIRYALWIMSEVDGAGHLLAEMGAGKADRGSAAQP